MKPENIIKCMSNFDGSQLDGHLLKLLLAVLETGSITAAAERLGVTQSAVSHLLDKLRAITGDPLFVKRGR
jgi:DNA-binding transcriptional LysR family regulator